MPSAAHRETRKPTPEATRALAGRWLVDPQASHAHFVAGTLAGLVKIAGRFRRLSGHLVAGQTHATGALVLDSSSVDTGNRLRDWHLRSRGFFHAGRHPQLRYEAQSISSQDPGRARIDGNLVVAGANTPMSLDVAVRAPTEGVVELACQTEVDRVALGVRGARGMVPRAVKLDVVITLRQRLA
jgi:polyisoprenoid-binding protein YceI